MNSGSENLLEDDVPPPTFNMDSPQSGHIGILGDDSFGPYMDQIVQGETVNDRPLTIHRSRILEVLKACHVLFVSRSASGDLAQLLTGLQGRSVLTVGETAGFAAQGGIIDFYLEGGKVRFEINPYAARHCGLKIGSQMLSLARIVGPPAGKDVE